jgi:RNA polymerase sigma factor (sigma-70 family)
LEDTDYIKKTIVACKKKIRPSEEDLYRHFYAYALTVCMHYSSDRSEAEDVLIEGFYKVFSRIGQFDSDKVFKPWLRSIMVNAAIDHHRKYNKLDVFESNLFIEEEYNDISGAENLEYEELLEILQELPNQYRLVFNLNVMEGYNHEEISEKLGISASASRSNLTRAKQLLRKKIDVEGNRIEINVR